MQTKTTVDAEVEEQVARWRREQLTGAGFPLPLAITIAAEASYYLHALIELTERGCRPDLAVRILAPLDRDRTA